MCALVAPIKVAIVEDEIEMVKVLKRFFGMRGVPISFIAYDGKEAVERFRAATPKPDIVLLDNRLPYKDGITVAREIMAMDPRTQIIFLSADIQAEKEAIASGAALFIRKPSSLQVIARAIDAVSNGNFRPVPDR